VISRADLSRTASQVVIDGAPSIDDPKSDHRQSSFYAGGVGVWRGSRGKLVACMRAAGPFAARGGLQAVQWDHLAASYRAVIR
jgi:hypothetical protein